MREFSKEAIDRVFEEPTTHVAKRQARSRSLAIVVSAAPADRSLQDCLFAPLDIVVHREFIRVRALPERADFVFGLVPDPGVDDVFVEYVPTKQELMIFAQRLER